MQIRLSENIRALRRRHGLTQEQLAEALGMTPGAVYKWEAGLSQPELAVIVELADLFQVSMDVLVVAFIGHIVYHDLPLKNLPVVGKYFK